MTKEFQINDMNLPVNGFGRFCFLTKIVFKATFEHTKTNFECSTYFLFGFIPIYKIVKNID